MYSFEQNSPQIHPSAFVAPMSYISGNVKIAEHSSVWPMCVLRGDISFIEIGKYTNIQDGTVCHVTHASEFNGNQEFPLKVGDYVTVGHGAILHACTVKDFALIGMGSTILDGSVIESNTIVGANSLVTAGKKLESGFLWAGSPVKKVRELNDSERKFFKYSAEYYAKLAERTHNSNSDYSF